MANAETPDNPSRKVVTLNARSPPIPATFGSIPLRDCRCLTPMPAAAGNKDHAAKAVYKLESGNKQHWFSVNQRAMTNRWVHAGRFPLAGRAKVFLFCAEKTGNSIADSVAFKPAVEVSSGGREYCVRAFFPIEANKRPFKMTINGRDIGAVDVAQLTKLDRHTAVLEQVVSASGDVLIAFPGESKPSVSCVQVEKPERQSETPRP